MKNMNRICFFIVCILLMALAGTAAAQQTVIPQQCACLDERGIPYPEGTPGNTFCYQYNKDKVLALSDTLTLQQCAANQAAWKQQELLRQQAEEEARQKAAAEEAERQRLAAEEAARLAQAQAEAEEAARKAAEEAAQKAAEEAAQKAAEEAAQKAAEEAAQKAAEEAAQKTAEEAAQKAAEEAAQKAAEEAQRQAEAQTVAPGAVVPELKTVPEALQPSADLLISQTDTTVPVLLSSPNNLDGGNSSEGSDGDRIAVEPEIRVNAFSTGRMTPQTVQDDTAADDLTASGEQSGEDQQIPVLVPNLLRSGTGEGTEGGTDDVKTDGTGTSAGTGGGTGDVKSDGTGEDAGTGDGTGDVKKTDGTGEDAGTEGTGTEDALDGKDGEDPKDVSLEEKPADQKDEKNTAPVVSDGTVETDPVTEKITEGDKADPESGLSEAVRKELSTLLTNEELEDADHNWLTEEWLETNLDKLSESSAIELELILMEKTLNEETSPMVSLMMAPPVVSIEGELKGIQLSTPNGGTVTTAAVPFVWTYQYDESTPKTDVQFILSMTIKTEKDTVNLSTTVSSAACADSICKYTADLGAYKNASVTWDVSGTYESGGSTHTVNSAGSRSFTLKVADSTPTPTATIPPTQTQTPTMTPTATPKPKPKAPVQECPTGRYIVRNLGFYWAPSENAESYLVEWWNDRGQKGSLTLSNSDVTCQNKRCIASATLPGVGNYAWTVTAKNESGTARSGEMKFEIASNITTPQAYRPDGTIVNRTYPSFEWEDVRDGAIEYRIQVVGKYDSRIRMDRWFNVNDIYVGNRICYVQTDLFLPAGTYSWRVQARNKDFSSGWSSWRDFYVECDYCNYNNVYYNNYANTVPSCSFPAGTITVNKPEFQWRTLTGASYYMVKLLDSSGKTLFEKQVPNSNCTIELCTWNPDYTFTKNGNYTWSVAGYGGNGLLWNTAYGSFTYQGTVVMKAMSFLRPAQNGYLTDEAPVILWTDPGEAAALFHIEIFSNANVQLFSADLNREQAWCDGNTCSIEFKTIPDAENYRITVTPYSEFNTKGDMISLVFSKGGRILKLTSPKEGAAVSTRPMFRWTLEDGESTAYQLLLTDSQNNVTTISPLVCGAVGVTCEEGEAFYSPATALPAGAYTVRLSAAGMNALSEEVHITVK